MYLPMILSIMDKLNELNDKINDLIGNKIDNVFVGAAILGVIILVAFWGINTLNKNISHKGFFFWNKFCKI